MPGYEYQSLDDYLNTLASGTSSSKLDDAADPTPVAESEGIGPTDHDPSNPDTTQRLAVKVIRSARRTKSSAARVVGNTIEIRIPDWMDHEQEATTVDELVRKIERARAIRNAPIDLTERAYELAMAYDLPEPAEIRWVTNQNTRWGSCSTHSSTIRISSKLARVPDFVLNYVLVHELCHLVEANHGPNFHRLMAAYPECERAEGFLLAMSSSAAADRWLVD